MACHVELFCEDSAHEACARAFVSRVAHELKTEARIHVGSARFGLPRLESELRDFQETLRKGSGTPDLLVVIADANKTGSAQRRKEVDDTIDPSVFPRWVVGAPDPHVERWLLADPESFAQQFGYQPTLGSRKTRDSWKQLLVASLEAAGEIVTQGGAEFAEDIINAMDMYRASKNVPSVQVFFDDLTKAVKQILRDAS